MVMYESRGRKRQAGTDGYLALVTIVDARKRTDSRFVARARVGGQLLSVRTTRDRQSQWVDCSAIKGADDGMETAEINERASEQTRPKSKLETITLMRLLRKECYFKVGSGPLLYKDGESRQLAQRKRKQGQRPGKIEKFEKKKSAQRKKQKSQSSKPGRQQGKRRGGVCECVCLDNFSARVATCQPSALLVVRAHVKGSGLLCLDWFLWGDREGGGEGCGLTGEETQLPLWYRRGGKIISPPFP